MLNKPLKAWTLGELQEECSSHPNCEGCFLDGSAFCGQLGDAPEEWDLTEFERGSHK